MTTQATQPPPTVPALPRIILAVDGRTSPNPGPGGYAYVAVLQGPHGQELARHTAFVASRHIATPSRAMLFAVIRGLAFVIQEQTEGRWPVCPVEVTTYLDYITKGIIQNLPRWRGNGWKGSKGKVVKHAALWQQIAP
ncbi:MAG: RNase H family protein, partial [Gemmobacter sp.]|nr:RNase H family protein [Gemmobacter sp.]